MSTSSVDTGPSLGLDALLRSQGRYSPTSPAPPWAAIVGWATLCGFIYGAVMGAYDGRPAQAFYSAAKVPLLLAVTTLICLPNFFVLNTILGLRDDFASACRAVFIAQATMAATLAALAPVTAAFYALDLRYSSAVVLSGCVFLIGALAAQTTLTRHYAPLIAKDPRHRIALRTWIALYIFVGIQAAWVMRPYVGAPMMETAFFRRNAWSNAYVVVVDDVVRLFTGR